MHALPALIFDLTVMLGVASIITLILQKMHQPTVLAYLISGIIIGPYTPPYVWVDDIPNIKILSELGVIFLMFALGLDFSFHKLSRVGFSSSITGFIEVVLMSILGFFAGKALGWSFYDAIFLGAALSISSTTIIIKAIEELNLTKKRFAELVFGILIVEDLLAILLLVVLSTLVVTHDVFSLDMVWVSIKLILIVGGWFIGGYFIIPTLLKKVMIHSSEEIITVVSLGLCLFLVSVAAKLNYSTALGAFIMGSILAETPFIQRIKQLIMPIRNMFAAVFFISIGMLMDPRLALEQWPMILAITAITILGKFLVTGFSAFLSGQSLNTSLSVGLAMAQVGEFSFIIIGLGLSLNVISESLYPVIVTVAIITTFTTPYLIRSSSYFNKMLEKHLPPSIQYFIESYSAAIYNLVHRSEDTHVQKQIVLRLVVNAMVIAIIFSLNYTLVFPWVVGFHFPLWAAETLCWLFSVILSSPFIWGMLSSTKFIDLQTRKIHFNLGTSIAWTLTLIEISLLSFIYFQTWLVVVLMMIVLLTFFWIFYLHLEKAYTWFEQHLINNIKSKYEELAPWDTYLVEVEVGENSIFVGKPIRSYGIREDYGINIVAIARGSKILFAPKGDDILLANDKLIILGYEPQIERFRKKTEKRPKEIKEPVDLLELFCLKSIHIKKHNQFLGKTIRDSGIREKTHGIVVGLERNGKRILNPDVTTVLQLHDILFLAGETQYLELFEKT